MNDAKAGVGLAILVGVYALLAALRCINEAAGERNGNELGTNIGTKIAFATNDNDRETRSLGPLIVSSDTQARVEEATAI